MSSKYYGVSWNKASGKWKGQLQKGGRNRYLGMFVIEEEAAIAVQEKLDNFAEADRIRKILAGKQNTKKVKVVPPVKTVAVKAAETHSQLARRIGEERVKQEVIADAEDKKQEALSANGLNKIKDESAWQWECKGCGETRPKAPERCIKCNGISFKKIPVLKDPQAFLDRPEGRHKV